MSNTDRALWDRFRRGDDEAYTSIYRRYVQNLYFQGLQFTANKDIIKDCIQEVFIKIYKYRSNLGDTDNIKYYLLSSMRNQLISTLGKERSLVDPEPYDLAPAGEEQTTIEDELIELEDTASMRGRVERILSMLTPRQREAVRYRYIECLKTEEICALMDLNYQSLQNILSRSLKKIRLHHKIPVEK